MRLVIFELNKCLKKNIDLKTGESGVAGGGGKVNICG